MSHSWSCCIVRRNVCVLHKLLQELLGSCNILWFQKKSIKGRAVCLCDQNTLRDWLFCINFQQLVNKMVHISTLVVLLALSGVALSVRNLDARSLNGEFSKIIQLCIIQFFIWFPKEAESILQRWRFWGFAVVTRNRTCMYVCYFYARW